MTTNDPVGAPPTGAPRDAAAVQDPRDSIEDWLQEMSGIGHAPELRSGVSAPPPPAPGESPFDDPELDRPLFSHDEQELDRPEPDQRSAYEDQGYPRRGYDQQDYDQQQGYDQQGYDQQRYDQQGFDGQRYDEQSAQPGPRHGYDVEPDDEPTGSWPAFEVPRQSTGGRHRAED
jgi:hypothetical protein